MLVGTLTLHLQRSVRVPDGRVPTNLPPSLGRASPYKVVDYRTTCPMGWEDKGSFIGLHDKEAMWISFHAQHPVAVLVGAGGVNAITGEKLGTTLAEGNYLVTPPQPWLDGWKATDGSVYQFVAARFEAGKGITVGEQILGEESESGGIRIGVFEPKDPGSLHIHEYPTEGYGPSAYGDVIYWNKMSLHPIPTVVCCASLGVESGPLARAIEMGLGKGGRIVQKIYEDPHGIEAWCAEPSATAAIYLVNAESFHTITGQPLPPAPLDASMYQGPWFGLLDTEKHDIAGSEAFTGLQSVFTDPGVSKQPPTEQETI